MIQPAGTTTYRGRRSSRPGQESFEKDEKVLKNSEEFHRSGKTAESKAKAAEKEKIESAKKAKRQQKTEASADVPAEGNKDK